MALCESHLDTALPALKREESTSSEEQTPVEAQPKMETNGDIYQVPAGVPLSVDYRSPVSHFVPPAVEMYAARNKPGPVTSHSSNTSPTTPMKRKRGRPRVDKTSPEYLANLAARQQAREMAAMMSASMNNSASSQESGEKRKRGRPRVDKTSPEYLARKRAREIEALERKAKKEYKRRTGQDSAASSSAGDSTPRMKRKYTKRAPSAKNDGSNQGDRVKGKRGRPRKTEVLNRQQMPKIRVRSNLMPQSEPITLDSDDEPDLGSPSQASDSLSLDENLRALRHIHEKYANLDKDDMYSAHMVAVNFKKPQNSSRDDDVLSVRSSEGGASVKEVETRVEKLEDSSNSDSDSSSSGSSSSSDSSSESSDSSSSSDSSDDEDKPAPPPLNNDSSSFGAWSNDPHSSDSSDPERNCVVPPPPPGDDDVSCSENESADKSFQCHICSKWFSTRVTLKIHRRSHQNRGGPARARSSDRHECDECSEVFNRRDKLLQHKLEAHRNSMTVRCSVCRRCFEHSSDLAQHIATHTDDERAGRCSECGASFSRYDQLLRHMSTHGDSKTSHACKQCGKRFSHVHSLTRHMHNHARQLYRCVVCKASFARADQLAQHLNSHLANYKRLKP